MPYREINMKLFFTVFLLTFSGSVMAQWVEYSTRSNGDVYFYDETRVVKHGSQLTVWTRVRYATSIMAASSYQSLLKINCSENSETVLQSTFFTDKEWAKPAMATNTNVKPTVIVAEHSATEQLIRILCVQ